MTGFLFLRDSQGMYTLFLTIPTAHLYTSCVLLSYLSGLGCRIKIIPANCIQFISSFCGIQVVYNLYSNRIQPESKKNFWILYMVCIQIVYSLYTAKTEYKWYTVAGYFLDTSCIQHFYAGSLTSTTLCLIKYS